MAWHWYRGKTSKVDTRWDRVGSSPQQARLEALYAWERRCRGYDLFPEPVALEPGFVPYQPHLTAEEGGWDAVPQPRHDASQLMALSLLLPPEQKVTPGQMANLLSALRALRSPLSLEVIGDERSIRYQMVCDIEDGESVAGAFEQCFSEARIERGGDALLDALAPLSEHSLGSQVVDFGLYHPVYQPLRLFESFASAPQSALLTALGMLPASQVAGLQLLITPAQAPWNDSLTELVAQFSGERPAHPGTQDGDLVRALRYKLASPLWAVALRVFAVVSRSPQSPEPFEAAMEKCRALGNALGYSGESSTNGMLTNQLVALDDSGYDEHAHLGQKYLFDVLERRSRRSGMLLSQVELLGLWHPPTEAMRHPRLIRFDPHYRDLPDYLRDAPGVYLGTLAAPENVSSTTRESVLVPWPDAFRNRHAYLLGATRMGKSTLLLNLIAQDLLHGRGLCLIDPHGDLAHDVLARIPPEREDDVLFVDLSETRFPPAIGLLEAGSDWEEQLLVSDLLAILHRLFRASWGDRLEHILRHAVLTLLADHQQSHTLGDIRPLLSNAPYREAVLQGVSDPGLRSFWRTEFAGYSASSFAPVYNKLGLLMSSPVVRNILSNPQSKLRPAHIIENRQILLVNLAQSLIGEDNAHFLGALIVSQIQLAAMHNLRRGRDERVPFTLYVDEFQNFVVSSFEKILSEAGKAGLTIVMANQFLEQLGEGLQKAILSNVGTLVSFRVSAESGRVLQGEFGGLFGAKELTDLERGQAVVRLGRAGDSFALRTFPPVEPDTMRGEKGSRDRIIERTRDCVCRLRHEVEREIVESQHRLEELLAAAEAAERRAKVEEREAKQTERQTKTASKPATKQPKEKATTTSDSTLTTRNERPKKPSQTARETEPVTAHDEAQAREARAPNDEPPDAVASTRLATRQPSRKRASASTEAKPTTPQVREQEPEERNAARENKEPEMGETKTCISSDSFPPEEKATPTRPLFFGLPDEETGVFEQDTAENDQSQVEEKNEKETSNEETSPIN